ncbi:unnamed protein product [Schistosoma margrebowiei]|uniref:Ig-like domain-containing protein n=1 Tax=Schistosoma margrebowiei TaxID=48269 RepID=A0AA85AKW3_9TREM|nr:unnamed protein product [Schistosoma margrebowiei]
MSPIFYIINIYLLQNVSFTTCNTLTYKLNQENLNLSSFEHLMITGESLMEIHNDIYQMKTTSNKLNIKTYELKPNEEILYTDIPQYIIQPPSILYTSKWQPAIVYCVAEPVILLYIVCVTNPIHSNARYEYNKEYIELLMNQTFKQYSNLLNFKLSKNFNINISNKQNRKTSIRLIDENTVEEWFGDYWCQCEAWNNILKLGEPRVKISNQTHIRIAYLNKRFIKHPESTRIPLGWTVEFTCEPPDGRPIPKVYWMKNGRKLEMNHFQDPMSKSLKETNNNPNYQIINHDLNINDSGLISRLIIRHTHLNDEGVYTCVVENQAGRRISSNAQLTIHTDGHWSTWSPWSNCPNDCVILQPNSTMLQLSNHSKILEHNNKLICSTQCRQSFGQRTRWCNAPEPHGGGRKCHGENTEHLSCYDICLDNLTNSQQIYHDENNFLNERKQITILEFSLLFGLGLAILFFLIAATCVLYILANKFCPIMLKLLPNETLLSINLLHSLIHWSKCKQTINQCHTTKSYTQDFDSIQQFMEYKSEIIYSPNFNCQQSLHYDCVSLIPLNKYNSRSIISMNQIYTDDIIHPRIESNSYMKNYNLERVNYQFNNNKYCDNSMNQFHMNVPIQSNSQMKSYNHINTERNILNQPLYLTHSHSTQFINNLQTLKEFNHQITDNLYNLNHSFNHLNVLLNSRDEFPNSIINQRYFSIPTTSMLNTKLTTMEDNVNPYFSVVISPNQNDTNSGLNSLNSRRKTIIPISS